MPTWAAAAPGTVPTGQLRRRGFPQNEIAWIPLIRRDLHTGTGKQFFSVAAGELAVIRKTADREQYVSLGFVCVTGGDQTLDDLDHFLDVAGGARLHVRQRHAQSRHVAVIVLGRFFGQRADRDTEFGGARVDLVLHVREIPNVGDLRIQAAQQPHQNVVNHLRAGVTDMREVVDRRAADIHPDYSPDRRARTARSLRRVRWLCR